MKMNNSALIISLLKWFFLLPFEAPAFHLPVIAPTTKGHLMEVFTPNWLSQFLLWNLQKGLLFTSPKNKGFKKGFHSDVCCSFICFVWKVLKRSMGLIYEACVLRFDLRVCVHLNICTNCLWGGKVLSITSGSEQTYTLFLVPSTAGFRKCKLFLQLAVLN